jgi:hypothetical protein
MIETQQKCHCLHSRLFVKIREVLVRAEIVPLGRASAFPEGEKKSLSVFDSRLSGACLSVVYTIEFLSKIEGFSFKSEVILLGQLWPFLKDKSPWKCFDSRLSGAFFL